MTKLAVLASAGLLALGTITVPVLAQAHSGGTNADGCHTNRKTGDYHCHGGKKAPPRVQQAYGGSQPQRASSRGGTVFYANCSAARAAGAAPVRRGDPGYAPHLDRDNDGVGCE